VRTVRLAALLAPAAAVAAIGLFPRGFIHLFGIDTQQSDNYDFVSGAGPILTTLLLGSGALIAFLRRHNCHQHRCLRVGRHPVAGGQFVVCRRHHPDVRFRAGVQAHHIAAAHEAHLSRRKAPG
jgi:hypothetical protein